MAKHQIIYTSCMRGIDGVNDGQQVFSYDERFSDCKSEDVKSLFTYQVPNLQPGLIMTEKIAATMPEAFSYRLLKNGSAAIVLNTYLGRDYMGSAGRFGNHLCHVIVTDFSDMSVYPCELYGGPSLRKSMKYEEVNNSNPPEFLKEPALEKGYVINPDVITEFLEIGNNLEYYKQMVVAMLRYPTEKKRVIICDERENIVKWIAALHYALPLDIAKSVNFTTYEFDPELSSSQICGVINEGSRYDVGNYISEKRHYIFDFINSKFSEIVENNPYLDFLDTAFSFSYDSLQQFHNFIKLHTSFRKSNEKLYSGYYLFSFLKDGISEITLNQFKQFIEFAEKYTKDEMKLNIVSKIIEEENILNEINNEYALTIFRYLLNTYSILNIDQKNAVKKIIVDRIVGAVSDSSIEKEDFISLYNDVDNIARNINLSIPSELMNNETRQRLLDAIGQTITLWKVYFVVRVISEYVKDTKVPLDELYPDRPIGRLYYGILRIVYSAYKDRGFDLVKYILDGFKDSGTYLINMALNIEGFLNDLELDDKDTKYMWDYFTSLVSPMTELEIHKINEVFSKYERFEEMYMLYKLRIKNVQGLEQARKIFRETFDYWSEQKQKSAVIYAKNILKSYEEVYKEKNGALSSEDNFKYAKEILHCAMKVKVKDDYVNLIIAAISEYIPAKKPNRENERLITEMQQYQLDVHNQTISDRLLLLYIGVKLNKIVRASDLESLANQVMRFSDGRGADVTELDSGEIEDYFKWMFKCPLKCSLSKDDLTNIYKLFTMSGRLTRYFMEYCCKNIYKNCKRVNDNSDFAEFLLFMFEYGNDDDIECVGKYLCKLSKQRLEELDEDMSFLFKRERKAANKWKEIRDIAQNTNSLINNLSGLFKRKNI